MVAPKSQSIHVSTWSLSLWLGKLVHNPYLFFSSGHVPSSSVNMQLAYRSGLFSIGILPFLMPTLYQDLPRGVCK